MLDFVVHSIQTAPENARPVLEQARASNGFVPNLYATMAESPALLEGYTALARIFESSALTPVEQQVVLLAASYANDCCYCVAAHSTECCQSEVPAETVEALRAGTPVRDAKHEALRRFTIVLVEKRGLPSDEDVAAFLDAGYTRAQVLDVILGVGLKTMSNYTNHIADTALDDAFKPLAWAKYA